MLIKDLTLEQLVNICKSYYKRCDKCPLFYTSLHCFSICDASECDRERIHKALEEEIDTPNDTCIDGVTSKFVASHLKKALWNLKCAVDLDNNSVDAHTIRVLKNNLTKVLQNSCNSDAIVV